MSPHESCKIRCSLIDHGSKPLGDERGERDRYHVGGERPLDPEVPRGITPVRVPKRRAIWTTSRAADLSHAVLGNEASSPKAIRTHLRPRGSRRSSPNRTTGSANAPARAAVMVGVFA